MGTVNDMVVKNQFGEESILDIESVATSGANTIVAAITSQQVTGKLLTGLAAGTNTSILATDSILVALAKLQAQIDALP